MTTDPLAPPDRPERIPDYEAYAVVLEQAIRGVLNAYGDKGWAQSEMCRRLRRALKDAKAASTRVAGPARAHQEEKEQDDHARVDKWGDSQADLPHRKDG